jgi:hypothetical protein
MCKHCVITTNVVPRAKLVHADGDSQRLYFIASQLIGLPREHADLIVSPTARVELERWQISNQCMQLINAFIMSGGYNGMTLGQFLLASLDAE